jgi:two-component system, NtrC family, sensor histidine kinase PilS
VLRWVFIGRLCVASAIFIAAVLVWTKPGTDTATTLVASLAFALATVTTVVSAAYGEIYRKRLSATFLYLQAVFDLLLVTAVVHVTNGSSSQFSALYILVIATASLMVPVGGGLLVAALGSLLYFADVVWFLHSPLEAGLLLQLGIFAVVALGSAHLSAKLRERGEGSDQLAAELQQARLHAEDILRNIRSGVVTVDAQGRLLYANPMAEQILGIDLMATYAGHLVFDVLAQPAPELAHAIRRTAVHKIRTTRGESGVSAGGRRFPVGVTTTFTESDEEEGKRTATAIFQDISDQKRIDALRLRAERLEGIAELSASLAHEIKNPLASIRSAVEQLSRMPQVSDDEKTLGGLVLRESDRLSRLLSEFLDFARVRVARTEPVNLATVAQGAAMLAASHPDRAESVRIQCVVPEGELLQVDGDEDLLHRAIFNLALNAVQAAPADSEVCIEVARGSFDPLPAGVVFDDGAVAIRVTDAGAGIRPEIRDRLFDPFFTTKPQGSGLGLAVVHRAIEEHRGLVFVDSGTRGTRFTVILPSSNAPVRSAT